MDSSWQDYLAERKQQKQIVTDKFDQSFGTIGGGNHFAEFQAVDKIYDVDAWNELGLDKRALQLLIHSGSRGLGQSILVEHISEFNHDGLAESAQALAAYIDKHDEAVRWAELNRELIALRFLAAIRAKGDCVLDVNHNLVTSKTIANTRGWLHRKGATPSDKGFVMIPGSRGDYSYLVKPIDSDNTEISLFSLSHGAGRKWKRGECQGRLSNKYKREDLVRTELGSRVICGNKELLYDEAPQAYKKMRNRGSGYG